MTPVFPPTRCLNDFIQDTESDTILIQLMFQIQKEYDIKKLSLDEIKKIVREKEQH